ncbi:MAG: hypothetical protein IPN29_08440 [Saprospiraceae bacterium]|nr:hypothetical protein [Saprospiraceae bacterium]
MKGVFKNRILVWLTIPVLFLITQSCDFDECRWPCPAALPSVITRTNNVKLKVVDKATNAPIANAAILFIVTSWYTVDCQDEAGCFSKEVKKGTYFHNSDPSGFTTLSFTDDYKYADDRNFVWVKVHVANYADYTGEFQIFSTTDLNKEFTVKLLPSTIYP